MMLQQATVAAVMQDRQGIDRAVERQLAPEAGQDVRAPFMGMPLALRSSSQKGAVGWLASPSQV